MPLYRSILKYFEDIELGIHNALPPGY